MRPWAAMTLVVGLFGGTETAFAAGLPPVQTKAAQEELARPTLGGTPAWVSPATATPPVPQGSEGDASVTLLSDFQVRFAGGVQETYVHSLRKIVTAQGLSDGSLRLDWDPSTQDLTLHSYRILRGDQSINLLADASKLTVIRRETDLENATLDGQLTAVIEPEDVQVGDIIDLAYTRTLHDPAMQGHAEAILGPADGSAYGRYRLRVIWPDSVPLRWQAYPGAVQPKLTRKSGQNELLVDLSQVTTPRPPSGAPSRFTVINAVELSDHKDWSTVAQSFLPLFEKAGQLSAASPVKAEAARIMAQTADPKRRAELALQTVQNKIRYLSLTMADGGFVPAPAELTWSRRYGDCKAKTVLLLALLREMQISAQALLVNTGSGDFVATRMPAMSAFDHVIVEADLDGRRYYLDGTRLGDTSLDRIDPPGYRAGLPVTAGKVSLETLVPADYALPTETVSLDLDASKGIDLPAVATGEIRYRGQTAVDQRVKYAGYSAGDRQDELRKLWRKLYEVVQPVTVTTRDDLATGDYILAMTGTAKMEWIKDSGTRWYELDRAALGWKLDLARDNQIRTDAPYSFDYPDFFENRETIRLPNGGKDFTLIHGDPIDQTSGGLYRFHRKVAIKDGVVSMEVSTKALAAELPASKAEQVKDELSALTAQTVYIRLPTSYVQTDAELQAVKGNKPAYTQALIERAIQRMEAGDYATSKTDIDAALLLAPTNTQALTMRSMLLAKLREQPGGATSSSH